MQKTLKPTGFIKKIGQSPLFNFSWFIGVFIICKELFSMEALPDKVWEQNPPEGFKPDTKALTRVLELHLPFPYRVDTGI